VGQEWLGPSYFFISLVLGPLNSLLEESTDPNRYTAKAKFCFCKNNKRMIIMQPLPLLFLWVLYCGSHTRRSSYGESCILRPIQTDTGESKRKLTTQRTNNRETHPRHPNSVLIRVCNATAALSQPPNASNTAKAFHDR
jgi:hypothetical protein